MQLSDSATFAQRMYGLLMHNHWSLSNEFALRIDVMNDIMLDVSASEAHQKAPLLTTEQNMQLLRNIAVATLIRKGAPTELLEHENTCSTLWSADIEQWIKTVGRLGNIPLMKAAMQHVILKETARRYRYAMLIMVMAIRSRSLDAVKWLLAEDIDWRGVLEEEFRSPYDPEIREYRKTTLSILTSPDFKDTAIDYDLISLFETKYIVQSALSSKRHSLLKMLRDKGETEAMFESLPHYIKFVSMCGHDNLRDFLVSGPELDEFDAKSVVYCLQNQNHSKLGFGKNGSVMNVIQDLKNSLLTQEFLQSLAGSMGKV